MKKKISQLDSGDIIFVNIDPRKGHEQGGERPVVVITPSFMNRIGIVIKIIQGLDDNSSMDDIHYHLYVKQKVEHGLEALKEGRYIKHEEVKEKLAKWLDGKKKALINGLSYKIS